MRLDPHLTRAATAGAAHPAAGEDIRVRLRPRHPADLRRRPLRHHADTGRLRGHGRRTGRRGRRPLRHDTDAGPQAAAAPDHPGRLALPRPRICRAPARPPPSPRTSTAYSSCCPSAPRAICSTRAPDGARTATRSASVPWCSARSSRSHGHRRGHDDPAAAAGDPGRRQGRPEPVLIIMVLATTVLVEIKGKSRSRAGRGRGGGGLPRRDDPAGAEPPSGCAARASDGRSQPVAGRRLLVADAEPVHGLRPVHPARPQFRARELGPVGGVGEVLGLQRDAVPGGEGVAQVLRGVQLEPGFRWSRPSASSQEDGSCSSATSTAVCVSPLSRTRLWS